MFESVNFILTALLTGAVAGVAKALDYTSLLKALWRRRPVQMLTSMVFIWWAVPLFNQPLVGPLYEAFEYIAWPWRSIVSFVVGASWPIVTIAKGEDKARDILGIQALLLIYMAFHMIDMSTFTGFFMHLTLGILAFDQRGETPITKPSSAEE